MIEFTDELYQQLEAGIHQCERNSSDYKKRFECCFHICKSMLQQLEDRLQDHQFADDTDEINFFKNINPRFTSLVEFYSTAYSIELFAPDEHEELVDFLKQELQRSRNFVDKNNELREYLGRDGGDSDSLYFLRSSPEFKAIGEQVVRLLARERMIEYLRRRLGQAT